MFPCPFLIRVNAAPKHAHPGSKKLGKQRSGKYALCATYCNKGEARFFKLSKMQKGKDSSQSDRSPCQKQLKTQQISRT